MRRKRAVGSMMRPPTVCPFVTAVRPRSQPPLQAPARSICPRERGRGTARASRWTSPRSGRSPWRSGATRQLRSAGRRSFWSGRDQVFHLPLGPALGGRLGEGRADQVGLVLMGKFWDWVIGRQPTPPDTLERASLLGLDAADQTFNFAGRQYYGIPTDVPN